MGKQGRDVFVFLSKVRYFKLNRTFVKIFFIIRHVVRLEEDVTIQLGPVEIDRKKIIIFSYLPFNYEDHFVDNYYYLSLIFGFHFVPPSNEVRSRVVLLKKTNKLNDTVYHNNQVIIGEERTGTKVRNRDHRDKRVNVILTRTSMVT